MTKQLVLYLMENKLCSKFVGLSAEKGGGTKETLDPPFFKTGCSRPLQPPPLESRLPPHRLILRTEPAMSHNIFPFHATYYPFCLPAAMTVWSSMPQLLSLPAIITFLNDKYRALKWVVDHGCRKTKKIICGMEGENFVAYGRLPSQAH